MGFLRRKDERAMPKPGSKEFEEVVASSAPPTADEPAAAPTDDEQPERPEATIQDQQDSAEEAEERAEGGEPARGKKVLGALGRSVLRPPNAEGFGGGIPGPKQRRKPEG
jgi:hypothetical protein